MSDETLIVKIEIDQAVVNASKQRATELARELLTLKKEQNDLKKSTEGNIAAQKASAGTMAALQAKIASTTKEYKQNVDVLKQAETVKKAQNGSNEKLRAQLSILTNQYNKLSKEERVNSTVGKDLESSIRSISDELKANESAIGDNRRNVGNYGDALKDLKQDLREAKDAMVAAAASNGVNSDAFREAAEKAGALSDRIREVNEATATLATGSPFEQLGNSAEGVTEDIKNLDFEGAAEKAAQLQAVASKMTFAEMRSGLKSLGTALARTAAAILANPMFIFAAVVLGVGLAIKALIDRNEEAEKAQKDYNKAIDGTVILDEALRNSYSKSVIEIQKMQIEYDRLTGKISDFQAEIKNIEIDYNESLKTISDETEKKLDETVGWWQKFQMSVLHQNVTGQDAINDIVNAGNLKRKTLDEKFAEQKLIAEEKKNQDINEMHREALRELAELENETIKNDFEREKKKIQTASKFAQEDIELSKNTAEDKTALVAALKQKENSELEKLNQDYNDKIAEQNKKAAEEAEALRATSDANREALRQQQEAALAEQAAIMNKFFEDRMTEYDRERKALHDRVADLRFAGVEEVKIAQYVADEIKKIRVKEIENDFKAAEDKINEQADLAKNLAIAEISDADKRADVLLKIDQERLESLKNLYDINYQSQTASLDGIVIYDQETKDLMMKKYAEFNAKIAQANRDKNAIIEADDEAKRKREKEAAIQAAQEITNAIAQITSQQRQADFDAAISKLNEQRDAELANSNLTEAQKKSINDKYKKLEAAEKTKQFKKEKEAAIVLAVINTALAVIKALPNYINAALAGIAGGAQIAIIANQPTPKFARGTFLSNGQGTETSDSIPAMLSKNETVINAKSSKAFLPVLSAINEWGGGVAFASHGAHVSDTLVQRFAGGGVASISNQAFADQGTTDQVTQSIREMVPVLVLEEFQNVQGKQVRTATNLEL